MVSKCLWWKTNSSHRGWTEDIFFYIYNIFGWTIILDLRVVKFSANFIFWENCSFKDGKPLSSDNQHICCMCQQPLNYLGISVRIKTEWKAQLRSIQWPTWNFSSEFCSIMSKYSLWLSRSLNFHWNRNVDLLCPVVLVYSLYVHKNLYAHQMTPKIRKHKKCLHVARPKEEQRQLATNTYIADNK